MMLPQLILEVLVLPLPYLNIHGSTLGGKDTKCPIFKNKTFLLINSWENMVDMYRIY